MEYFYNTKIINEYPTNCGGLFIIEDKVGAVIFVTSDYSKVDEFIYKGDSNLYVGREFYFIDTEKNYRITNINILANSDTKIEFYELCGKRNKYSFKVVIKVQEIQN